MWTEKQLDDLVDEWHERPTFYPHVTLKQFLMDRTGFGERAVTDWLMNGGNLRWGR
jgi:hypothetical protein